MDHTDIIHSTAIYAFTSQGVALATRLVHLLHAEEKSFCFALSEGGSDGGSEVGNVTLSQSSIDSALSKDCSSGTNELLHCSSLTGELHPPLSSDPFACTEASLLTPSSSSKSSPSLTVFVPERLDVAEQGTTDKHTVPLQRYSSLSQLLAEQFTTYKFHIFIGAMGIVVRSIAPYLQSKTSDPAVIVIDQKGQFVISVLSGHIGKANELTEYVAKKIHAMPVITTATDVEGLPAIDSLATKNGLRIDNMEAAKNISAALLASKKVQLYDPYNWLHLEHSSHKDCFVNISHSIADVHHVKEENAPIVIVTEKSIQKNSFTLVLAPPLLCAGIGCKRGTSAKAIITQLTYAFEQKGLSLSSLHSLASVDVKKDEQGLLAAAEQLGVPLFFFSPEELDAYPTKNVSEKCLTTFGIKGVCESAALAAAGKNAQLIQEKIAGKGVTIALASRTKNNPTGN